MRLALVMVVAAVFALPAAAATIQPRNLAVAASDVPAGFRVDPAETGVRTNERDLREVPEARERFTRWQRLIGYQSVYRRGPARIESRSDVFRAAAGARGMLSWVDLETRKAGLLRQRRASLEIGAGGFLHWVGGGYTFVVWRQGRVFTGVFAEGISRARTIALARAQARRIARELARVGP